MHPLKHSLSEWACPSVISGGQCPLMGIKFRIRKSDPYGPAVSARVAPVAFRALSAREQPIHRRVDVQVFRFPPPRHHHIGATKESDKDAARHLEQRIAVRR